MIVDIDQSFNNLERGLIDIGSIHSISMEYIPKAIEIMSEILFDLRYFEGPLYSGFSPYLDILVIFFFFFFFFLFFFFFFFFFLEKKKKLNIN